jgi:type IV pilus assembly protein PilQ
MIDFQVLEGISRIAVKVNGDINADQPIKTPGFITLTIKNAVLSKNLQRSMEASSFVSPVLRVTPLMVKAKKGTDTKVRIAMRFPSAFEMRQEGDMLFVDIKHPEGLTADKLAIETTDTKLKSSRQATPKSRDEELSSEIAPVTESSVKTSETSRGYKGRKVTLEFADAEVRKIFQLLSEVSNKNFVLGDDVTGAISLKLVNVPWDQALDIILDTKGLDKREDGNIILIKGKGKFKSQAEEEQEIKKALTKAIELKTETFNINYADIGTIASQFNGLKSDRGIISQDARTNKVIVKDIPQILNEMRKLLVQLDVPEKQVMIEARIVEASSTFTRNLGVNWGVHYRDGSASFLGINSLDTGFGGLTSPPPTSGTGSSAGGSMGISFGTLSSNIQLDMRLNAAASAGMVKIVSTPKVATLNNKTAKITQGQQIPYTSSTSDKVETKFIEAALSLEVTPHINANGTIGMKIDAKNDSPGQSTGTSAPPINKKQATTEMLLRDGETTVIGGIYVDSDNTSDDGVPYLMDIPLLGKLFKTNNKTKTKTELLIFITPRILGTI